MSRENVDLVLESIRRFRPGGLDEWAELWHQDTRMTIPEGWPEPGPFIGLDAVKREFERGIESFSAPWRLKPALSPVPVCRKD
jgi:ketosteroid isomerase-like protein